MQESTLGLLPNPFQKHGIKFAATYIGCRPSNGGSSCFKVRNQTPLVLLKRRAAGVPPLPCGGGGHLDRYTPSDDIRFQPAQIYRDGGRNRRCAARVQGRGSRSGFTHSTRCVIASECNSPGQWRGQTAHHRCADHRARCASRTHWSHWHEEGMRPLPMRRLHRSDRRPSGGIVHDAGARRAGSPNHHHRRPGEGR